MANGSRIARLLHLRAASSLWAIMNAGIEVLNEKFSISHVIFLMSLCRLLSSSFVGCSSVTVSYIFHAFFRKRCTPSMPLVSQGLDISSGPRNISYRRKVSAP